MQETAKTVDTLSWRRIIGFGCYQGFVFSAFYMGSNHELALGPFMFERAEMLLTLVFMLAMFAGFRLAPASMERIASNKAAMVLCSVLLTAGSCAHLLPDAWQPLAVVLEGLCLGPAMAFLLIAWGRALGASSPRYAATEIFTATALAGVACFLLWLLPNAAAFFIPRVLPLASGALLLARTADHDSISTNSDFAGEGAQVLAVSDASDASADASSHGKLSRKALAGAALFGVAAGFVEAYRSDPGALSTPAFPATLIMLAIFCVAVLQALSSDGKDEQETFGSMYRISFLVIMAGFLFAPAFGGMGIGIPGDSVVLAGYLGLTSVFMSLFLALAHISGMDASVAFSRGFFAIYGGQAVGIVAANVFDGAVGLLVAPYFFMAAAGLVALFAYLFLFKEEDFRQLSAVVDQQDYAELAYQMLVERAKLSERESQVLALALKGRTNERIAQELVVAKSTADTHLRRIYAKCGVHSRQELIDLHEELQKKAAATD